jgi:secreted PhoX family phosphatase
MQIHNDQTIVINDTDDIGSNPTQNPHIMDIIEARVSRRNVLGGGLALAAGSVFGTSLLAPNAEASGAGHHGQTLIGFTEVAVSSEDVFVVPEGYTTQILAPWGTPLLPGAPAFAEDASNTAADQELQVGFNHDGMHYFPLWRGPLGNRRGLLVLNHEYTDANQIYSAAQGRTITPTPPVARRSRRPSPVTASR